MKTEDLLLLGLGIMAFSSFAIPIQKKKKEYPVYPQAHEGMQLTEKTVQLVESLPTVKELTPEITQVIQPFPTPAIVTSPVVPELTAKQVSNGFINPYGGRSGDFATVIMQIRDTLRANGQAKAILTTYWLDGRVTKQTVYA